MDMTLIIAVAAIIVALLVLVVVMRRKPTGMPAPERREHLEVGDGPAAAVEDVVDQFLGIDSHPDTDGPPDDLTRLKGLGPKAAAQLNGFGITRYAQLAALNPTDIAAVDAHMGVFRGRIGKDRWVEQAAFLAADDTAGFEATFGKLG